jgi:hypothetical protein
MVFIPVKTSISSNTEEYFFLKMVKGIQLNLSEEFLENGFHKWMM